MLESLSDPPDSLTFSSNSCFKGELLCHSLKFLTLTNQRGGNVITHFPLTQTKPQPLIGRHRLSECFGCLWLLCPRGFYAGSPEKPWELWEQTCSCVSTLDTTSGFCEAEIPERQTSVSTHVDQRDWCTSEAVWLDKTPAETFLLCPPLQLGCINQVIYVWRRRWIIVQCQEQVFVKLECKTNIKTKRCTWEYLPNVKPKIPHWSYSKTQFPDISELRSHLKW